MMQKKVLIVDDSKLMRIIIKKILSSDDLFVVTGEAGNGIEALSEIEKLLCWLAVYKHMIYKDNKLNINSWWNVKSTVDEYKGEILDANQKLAIPYAIDKLDVATVSCKYKEFFNAQKKRTRNRNLDGIMWIQDEAFTSSNAFLKRHKHLKDIINKMRGPILQT